MNAAQRRMIIYRILEEQTTVEVNALSEKLGVSTMTIRRDLALFEKQGLVVTNYGGAYLVEGAGVEPGFSLKRGQMNAEKDAIGMLAAQLVKSGNSIVLDCGTTPLQIAKQIASKNITVITNSWPAIKYLHGNSKLKLILAPGIYDETSAGVFGGLTSDFYHQISADIVFMSTQGFSMEYGASVPNDGDAALKRTILKSARKRVLVMDHTKFGKKYLMSFAGASDFDVIITDDGIQEDQLNMLKSVCNEVLIAKQTSTSKQTEDDIFNEVDYNE